MFHHNQPKQHHHYWGHYLWIHLPLCPTVPQEPDLQRSELLYLRPKLPKVPEVSFHTCTEISRYQRTVNINSQTTKVAGFYFVFHSATRKAKSQFRSKNWDAENTVFLKPHHPWSFMNLVTRWTNRSQGFQEQELWAGLSWSVNLEKHARFWSVS